MRWILLSVLMATTLLVAAPRAEAQVLVYRMQFEKEGRSINFSFFDQAFFVVDALGGTGSFIFTFVDEGRDFYLQSDDAGELFFAVKGSQRRAVIRATAENGSAISHYLVIGDLNETLQVDQRGQPLRFAVATSLRGDALASDPESDVAFPSPDDTLGFAGAAEIRTSLQRQRTQDANALGLDVAQTTQAIVDQLERLGFSDAENPDPTPDPDPDPTPFPEPITPLAVEP